MISYMERLTLSFFLRLTLDRSIWDYKDADASSIQCAAENFKGEKNNNINFLFFHFNLRYFSMKFKKTYVF